MESAPAEADREEEAERETLTVTWLAVEIDFSCEWTERSLEAAAARLSTAGSLGWQEEARPDGGARWIVYFPEGATKCLNVVEAALSEACGAAACPFELRLKGVAEEDWMAGHRAYFKPFAVSKHFAVAPPWFEGEWPFPGRERIIIYPAMAFGTGTHETTRLAAQALEDLAGPGRSVLDVGTGSGILAIIAAKMGAAPVAGLDIDARALENARENCRLNGLEDRVALFCGGPKALRSSAPFDIIAANILYQNLQPLLPGLAARLAQNASARLVLGGFLNEQRDEVARDLAALGLTPCRWDSLAEWSGMVAAWRR